MFLVTILLGNKTKSDQIINESFQRHNDDTLIIFMTINDENSYLETYLNKGHVRCSGRFLCSLTKEKKKLENAIKYKIQ